MPEPKKRRNANRVRNELARRGLAELASDIRGLIEAARRRLSRTANTELVLLYWQIGTRIRRDVLGEARAEYGEEIVSTLSRQLTTDYGVGFSRQNLFHMIRFAEAWPDQALAKTSSSFTRQIGSRRNWSFVTRIC